MTVDTLGVSARIWGVDERIARLYREGRSLRQIAAEVGLSHEMIRRRLDDMRIRRRGHGGARKRRDWPALLRELADELERGRLSSDG